MQATSILPLTLTQKDLMSSRGNGYCSIRFKGTLSVPALCRALAFIVRRHEGLRMRVVRTNEQPQQRLVESIHSYEIPVICVQNLAAAKEHIMTCVRSPADLENDGPLHAELMRIG